MGNNWDKLMRFNSVTGVSPDNEYEGGSSGSNNEDSDSHMKNMSTTGGVVFDDNSDNDVIRFSGSQNSENNSVNTNQNIDERMQSMSSTGGVGYSNGKYVEPPKYCSLPPNEGLEEYRDSLVNSLSGRVWDQMGSASKMTAAQLRRSNMMKGLADSINSYGDEAVRKSEYNKKNYGPSGKYGGFEAFRNREYYLDPRGLTADIGDLLGSYLPSLLLNPVSKVAIPAKLIARGGSALFNKIGAKEIAKLLGSEAGKKTVSTLGKNVLNNGISGWIDAGSIVDNLRKQGYSDDEIANKSLQYALEKTLIDMISDSAKTKILKGKLGKNIDDGNLRNDYLKRNFAKFAVDTPINTATGLGETILKEKYSNKPNGNLFDSSNVWTDDEKKLFRQTLLDNMGKKTTGTVKDYFSKR